MSLNHFARGAISAENARRRIILSGYTPNGFRVWNRMEAGNLTELYPDYAAALALNVRRTRIAHHGKAGRLGITRPRSPSWDVNELIRLHRLFPRASRNELLHALPRRTWKAICGRGWKDGYRRPVIALKPTGNSLLDQILSRARERNLSARELDAETRASGYFQKRKWRGGTFNTLFLARAVGALGGRMRARLLSPTAPTT